MSNQSFAAEQLLELLLQLKKTTPDAARSILNGQPQIAYALMTLMVKMNAVNFEVFQKTLADYGSNSKPSATVSAPVSAPVPTPTPSMLPSAHPSTSSTPVPALPPHLHPQVQHYRTATPPNQPYLYSDGQAPQPQPHQQLPYGQPPFQPAPSHPGYGYSQPQPTYGYPGYGNTPPVPTPQPMPAGIQSSLAAIPEEQKALIMRVITMTPDQLNALPPAERQTYIQLRNTLGVPT